MWKLGLGIWERNLTWVSPRGNASWAENDVILQYQPNNNFGFRRKICGMLFLKEIASRLMHISVNRNYSFYFVCAQWHKTSFFFNAFFSTKRSNILFLFLKRYSVKKIQKLKGLEILIYLSVLRKNIDYFTFLNLSEEQKNTNI